METQEEHVEFKGKQFRWTPAMEQVLINFLAQEVKEGRKVDKCFKKTSYVNAAKKIAFEFDVFCMFTHIENKLKAIRKKFNEVKKIRLNGSGFGWDDTKKMFICDDDVYKAYTEAHPNAAIYINKPIEMYDKLSMICGDDQATGSFAKSNTDENKTIDLSDGLENIESNETFDVEEITMTPNNTHNPDIEISQRRTHGKRKRINDEVSSNIKELANRVSEIAAALKFDVGQERVTFLHNEVAKVEGFAESDLDDAFEYLAKDDKLAQIFIAKGDAGRKRWLTKFISGI